MAKRNSQQWKALERQIAKEFNRVGIPAKRISRGADFGKEDVDVDVPSFPWLKIDGKYRKRHSHHTTYREIERKYCENPEDIAMLVTKSHNQKGAYATLPLDFVVELFAKAFNNKEN